MDAVLGMALTAACAAAVGCGSMSSPGAAVGGATASLSEGPVLGVLSCAPAEVVLIDADSLSVVRRVRLRSMGAGIVAVPRTSLFAVAQCGGVGGDADSAVGIVDAATGGAARYVELASPNPGSVDLLPDGTLAVSHGLLVPDGAVWSLVDPVALRFLGERYLGNLDGAPVVAAGSVWTVGGEGSDVTSSVVTLRRTSADFTTSEVLDRPGEAGCVLAADGTSSDTLIRVTPDGSAAVVDRVNAATLDVRQSSRVEDLSDRVCLGLTVGDTLVLADGTAEDPAKPGGPLVVLDLDSLTPLRRIDVGGSVSDMAALGGRLFAVTWTTGEVIEIDPGAGTVLRRTIIPGCGNRLLKVAASP